MKKSKKSKNYLTVWFIASLMVFVVMLGICIVRGIQFKQNCVGYLDRASNANSVELALSELKKATTYLEDNNLTSGYTSVLYKTPDEDISYWYNNLKSAEKDLESLTPKSTMLEKSNMLIKLRETLIEHGDKGEHIISPAGLSRYPNNMLYGGLTLVSLISFILSMIGIGIKIEITK